MLTFNKLVKTLVWLNIISITLNVYIFYPSAPEKGQKTQADFLTLRKKLGTSGYKFKSPSRAYQLLTLLDVNSTIPLDALPNAEYDNKTWWMLKEGFNYCERHRAQFVNDPGFIFGKPYIISNYAGNVKRKVIPKVGTDITIWNNEEGEEFIQDKHLLTSVFFTKRLFYYERQIGNQFSCLTQASSHIPGHDKLYRKDTLSQSLKLYLNKYSTRPECASTDKYFIKSFLLTQKEECKAFFEELNSEEYAQMKEERNVVYFRKIAEGVHQGSGVFIVNTEDEQYMKNLYKNGEECGNVQENNLIQLNIHNLLLLENRKFGFRSFMLVASTNPLIAYYHDGYARLTLNEYNPRSNETSTFVTNIHVNAHNPVFANWTKRQIDDYTYWPMEKFAKHLYKIGKVDDPKWLQNHLRKEFMKVKVHLLRMARGGFFNISSLFELYGLDYVMDENLNLWFIECNTKPLVISFNTDSAILFNRMLIDMFEIIMGLLRSRAKRIVNYINGLSSFGTHVPNLAERRREFALISQNYFEPEWVPSAKNSFYPIIDETKTGTERYFNLLEEQCL